MYLAHFNKNILSKYIQQEKENVVFIDYNSNMSGTLSENSILQIISVYREHGKHALLKNVIHVLFDFLSSCYNSSVIIHIESGASQYHLSINKEYKQRRGEYLLLDKEDLETFFTMYSTSKDILDLLCTKIPRISVISFRYMEADIVPFLVHDHYDEDVNMFMCSSDKDLFQCLQSKKFVFQLRQIPSIKEQEKRIVTNKTCIYAITNQNYNINDDIKPHIIPFLLSMSGDSSDNIKGIYRVGYSTIMKEFEKNYSKIDRDLLFNYSTVSELTEIYNKHIIPNFKSTLSKKIHDNLDSIIHNHKLIDFKIIKTYMDFSYKEQVKKVVQNKKNEFWTPDEVADILKELIWYDTEWIIKMRDLYTRILEDINNN